MEKYNNINIDKDDIVENNEFEITYSGYLKNNENKLFIHYGTNNWENVNDVIMHQTPEGYKAKISLPLGANEFNFAFRDSDENWDNNGGENFKYAVMPTSYNVDPTVTANLSTDFFGNDFLLAYNLNKEINFDNTKEELEDKENGIVKDENPIELSDEVKETIALGNIGLDKINFDDKKLFEIQSSYTEKQRALNSMLDQKFASLFNKIDNNEKENISEAILAPNGELNFEKVKQEEPKYIYSQKFTSNIAYVKLFKQAKQEALEELVKVNREKLFELNKVNMENINFENVIEVNKAYQYTTNDNIMNLMRMEANKRNVLLFAEPGVENKFALVSTKDEIDLYGNTLIGTIRKYFAAFFKSVKKLINIVQEDFASQQN